MKGRSPTMRHVSRTHRVALDWLFDRINLDSKIQIKYIDTKNQLADIFTKGNFTRGEWNHLLTLFSISHFSSTACIAAMAKRAQQESGEGRVTAKSRPMMNLTARTPSFVSSSASSNPGRTSYGYQDPGRSVASDDRTEKPVQPSRPDYTQEDYGRSWSSQEWKSGAAQHDRSAKPEEISWDTLQKVDPHREEYLLGRNAHSARYGELIHDRTGILVSVHHQEQAYFENFVMGSDAAEFVNQVRDQVRNRQKRMSSIAESCTEHSIIWRMFMAATLNAATFMGKNFSTIQSVVKNHESLTLKQMFDVTAQLVNNQEEINCLDKILYGKNSWTRLSLIDDEIVINLQRTKVYVFSDSVLCLGKVLQHPDSNEAWKNRVADTVDTIYRIILSVNQLSVYGAAVCEEFEDHQDRTEEPVILMGQSIVLGEVKAEAPLHDENPMNDQIIWQQYTQQVESLSPENRVSTFCKEAGFMRVVKVGQYFVTKDTGDFRQFHSVACREYPLPRDDPASQP